MTNPISKLFNHPGVKHLSIHQIAPGQAYYVKCPKTGKEVTVATVCIGCDALRGFSYEKKYLGCRGKNILP